MVTVTVAPGSPVPVTGAPLVGVSMPGAAGTSLSKVKPAEVVAVLPAASVAVASSSPSTPEVPATAVQMTSLPDSAPQT